MVDDPSGTAATKKITVDNFLAAPPALPLGATGTPYTALYLDNTATDGGSVYFDAGTTEFLKSDADGTGLKIGGFDELSPNAAATTALGTTTPFIALYLDYTATDGGAIYFDAGTTEFLKSDADGGGLKIGGFTDFSPNATATTTLGESTKEFISLYLDNGVTDSGAIYFDAGTTEYIKGNAAGTTLAVGGFTTIDFESATAIDFNSSALSGITTIAAGGAITGVTALTITSMGGNWTNAGRTVADMGILTTVDINGGTMSGVTVDGGLTWSAAQNLNSQALTNVNIDSGTADGLTSLTVANAVDIGNYDLRALSVTADSLTSGRIPFASTNGLLVDDADLTFATATLSATNLTSTGIILVGSTASTTDFPDTKLVSSYSDTAGSSPWYIGVVGEAAGVNAAQPGVGVAGYGRTGGSQNGLGVYGKGLVGATGDTATSYGGYFNAEATHAGGDNTAVYAYASGGANNYSFYGGTGNMYNAGNLEITGTFKVASGTALNAVTSGTWTPTLTNVTNIASSTAHPGYYVRLGNYVMFSVWVEITLTAADTNSELDFSLPVASNFTSLYDLNGVMGADSTTATGTGISYADATNDRGVTQFKSTSAAGNHWQISGGYVIK